MNSIHRTGTALFALICLALTSATRAETPDWINYQGILRDAAGVPRNGSFDMTFRFFDQPVGGNEILVDRHLAAGTGAVPVYDGLFEVWLGSGVVSDGAAVLPGDPYTTLADMFAVFGSAGFNNAWLEIEIGGEVLSPRVAINSVPYALHAQSSTYADEAGTLGGLAVGNFLDTSATFQTKAGSLQVNGALIAGGGALSFNHPQASVYAFADSLKVVAGDQPTDDLFLQAGLAADGRSGLIQIAGESSISLQAGNGQFNFSNGESNLFTAFLDGTGTFTAIGDLVAQGNDLLFGTGPAGARLQAASSGLEIWGGDADTDRIILRPGNDNTDGSVDILGGANIAIRAGNGVVNLVDASTGFTNASTDATGTFTVRNDLVATGNELRFGAAGARVTASASQLELLAGDADGDDLFLFAGNDASDGGIEILGAVQMNLRSGSGQFNFFNGATGTPVASIDPTGDILAGDDLVAGGGEVRFGIPGTRVTATANQLELLAGDANGDDLLLTAGNELTDGSIDIFGDNQITFRAGNGSFGFVDGATGVSVATVQTDGDGYEVHLGPIGSTRIVRNPAFDDVYIARDEDNNHADARFSIFTNVGIEQMRLQDVDDAAALFDGPVTANGVDYAEAFPISDPTLAAGDVVVFDQGRAGHVTRATEPYSRLLAGVISEKPGFLTGASFAAEEAADPELAQEMRAARTAGDETAAREISAVLAQKKKEQQRPVALAGRLPVKIDATYGEIHAGDHLTSSATPGHAMAMKDAGPSIGVALESWSGPGPGVILAFVQRGYYTPATIVNRVIEAQEDLARTVEARTPDPASGVQVLPSNLQLVLDGSGGQESRFSIFRDGEAAVPRAEVFRVDELGNVWAQGAFRPRSMDLAETFAVSEAVEPGDVLVVDRQSKGRYMRSRDAGDAGVVGVVASDPGVLLGGDVSRVLQESPELAAALGEARSALDKEAERAAWAELELRFQASHAAVALSGTVRVKVDAGYGAIEPGDLLISSPTAGHAMRASDPVPPGTVIGKALESIDKGTGTIRMIVMLR